MQQKQAGHAISLYFDLLLADEFVKPSVAPDGIWGHYTYLSAFFFRPAFRGQEVEGAAYAKL